MEVTTKLVQITQQIGDIFNPDIGVFKGENGRKLLDEILGADNWTIENIMPDVNEEYFMVDVYCARVAQGTAKISAYFFNDDTETPLKFVELVLSNNGEIIGRIKSANVDSKYRKLRTSYEESFSQPKTQV